MYDDLKRARVKLRKAYLYCPHIRSALVIVSQKCLTGFDGYGHSCAKHPSTSRSNVPCCRQHKDSRCFCRNSSQLGTICTLGAVRNRSETRTDSSSGLQGICGACESTNNFISSPPVYDFINDRVSISPSSGKLSAHRREWVRDIVSILRDVDILEKLFKVIDPTLHRDNKQNTTETLANQSIQQEYHCEGNATNSGESLHSVENDTDNQSSITSEQTGECGIDEELLSFSFDDDVDESYCSGSDRPGKDEKWYRSRTSPFGLPDSGWSHSSEDGQNNRSALFDKSHSLWEIKSEPNIFRSCNESLEAQPSLEEMDYPYECRPSSLPNECMHKNCGLPCLNHNTSLTNILDIASDTYLYDKFPLDEMMPFCSLRSASDFKVAFGEDEASEQGRDRPIEGEGDEENFIDTMKDTYTLSTGQASGEKIFPRDDDGARGDGIHFYLGLQPTWRCKDSTTALNTRSGLTISPDPSPQDRLARITYKTQPSDASSADAPMFVFSSSAGSVNTNVSSPSIIPLDFNLNAVYKTVPRDERGAGDTSPTTDEEESCTMYSDRLPERSDLREHQGGGSKDKPLSSRLVTTVGNATTKERCNVSLTSKPQLLSVHLIRYYLVLGVCVVILSLSISLTGNIESFLRLLWEAVIHVSLVGILLVVVLMGLEANNLTESVMLKLRRFMKGSHNEESQAEDSVQIRRELKSQHNQSKEKEDLKIVPVDHAFEDRSTDEQKQKAGRLSSPIESNFHVAETESTQFDGKPSEKAPPLDGNCGYESGKLSNNSNITEYLTSEGASVCSKEDGRKMNLVDFPRKTTVNQRSGSQSTKPACSEVSTMTDSPESIEGLWQNDSSVAQTMTDAVNLESVSTQTEVLCQDIKSEIKLHLEDIFPEEEKREKTSVSVQAEMDAKKIYQQTERLQQRHQSTLRKLQKKFLAIRRRCQKEAMDLKHSERRKNEFLSKLQLSLPSLQKEKCSLMAERASIDKQFEDEKRKNRELVGRLTRLNQQFYRLGQVQQQQPPPPPIHWRQQYQQQTYPANPNSSYSDQNGLLSHQQQQQQQKATASTTQQQQQQQNNLHHSQQQQQAKIPQQSTLLQNQQRSLPSLSSNQPQQIQQQKMQQHQQQQQMLHQQRLPIFQLFNKPFCQSHHDSQTQQQQPQQQQQQQQPYSHQQSQQLQQQQSQQQQLYKAP